MSSATAVAERATRLDNGKRGLTNFKANLQADLNAVVDGLVASNLSPEEVMDVFANSGVILPPVTLQNVLARRAVLNGDVKGIVGGGH